MLKLRVVTVMMVRKHEGDFNTICIRLCWADFGPLVSIQKFIRQTGPLDKFSNHLSSP